MKKIGLISDTHGHFDEKYIHYFSECDEIWHAGDVGNLEIIDQLNNVAPTRAVYGNIDDHKTRSELNLDAYFSVEKHTVFMTHIGGKPYSYPKRVQQKLLELNPSIFVCGHSHICKVQMDEKFNMLYINSGAAGIKGFHKIRTLIRFTIEQKNIKNLEVIELGNRTKLSKSV